MSPNLDNWKKGSRAWFEYHCNQSHDSPDAPAWYRSHQPVTVLGTAEKGNGSTLNSRIDNGEPRVYHVQYPDGLKWHAFEDELLTHPKHFTPEAGPGTPPPGYDLSADLRKSKAEGGPVTDDAVPAAPQRQLSPVGLYSHAADVVQRFPQMKGTPQQFKAMLT